MAYCHTRQSTHGGTDCRPEERFVLCNQGPQEATRARPYKTPGLRGRQFSTRNRQGEKKDAQTSNNKLSHTNLLSQLWEFFFAARLRSTKASISCPEGMEYIGCQVGSRYNEISSIFRPLLLRLNKKVFHPF